MANYNHNGKVYQYDLNGKFINEFTHAHEAAFINKIESTNIYQVLKGNMPFYKDYIWTHTFYLKLPKFYLDKVYNTHWKKYDCEIYQYDAFGILIKIWNNIKEINIQFGRKSAHIKGCLSGKNKAAYNSYWSLIKYEKYPKELMTKKMSIKPKRKKRIINKILQYDINGNFIKEWNSVKEAIKYCNIKRNTIYNYINKNKSLNGFIWKYKNILES
jgi:hypothetical protein